MKQTFKVFILALFIFSGFPIISNAQAHSLFNSSEETLGDYRVQIATQPEFPQIGEKSEVLIRVTDTDYNEVDRFTMGMRIFLNEEQIGLVPTTKWKLKNIGKGWVIGETLLAGIGQGYFQATPIQLCLMTAQLANGGYKIKPKIIKIERN